MGLDMYIEKIPKGKKAEYKNSTELLYWRKFNALHDWFVRNVQGGVDNCEYHNVTKEHLKKLIEDMEYTLETKNPERLMPKEGFFFGSPDVDDYYWYQVEYTLPKLKELLTDGSWDTNDIYYTSSW